VSFYHRLSNVLWGLIIALLVLLAMYVSIGRIVTANLGAYQESVLRELNARVPFDIDARRVSGQWQSFTPFIVLGDLRLSARGEGSPLALAEGRVGIDVWRSLRTRSLQVTRLELDELVLRGELTPEGELHFEGLSEGGGEAGEWLREFLLNIEWAALQQNLLYLTLPGGEVRMLDLDLSLAREGSNRQVWATLQSTRGTAISLRAQGVGDPFEPGEFSGDMYVELGTSDLGAMQDLFAASAPPVWASGELDLALWLSWEDEQSAVAARLDARNLNIQSRQGEWSFPLQRLALQGQVSGQRDHWTLYASDVALEQGGIALTLPRLQLDGWGNALRARAIDVPFAPLNALVKQSALMPEALREVLTALDLSGQLQALQLSIGDVEQPGRDWEVEGRFEEVALSSYRGAPGASGIRGHARLGPGGGSVTLDSRNASLLFPNIYQQPLSFNELYGSLELAWNPRQVHLSSGVLTALGEEGRARALLDLNIPLEPSDTGVEMALLVGLPDTTPRYRQKFIPSALNPTLLDWLAKSIGDEGEILEGAFLWRGSLRADAAPLRTVQLAFDVADVAIDYHPDWPPVTLHDGVLLIDDGRVSAWASSAGMLDSRVDNLSVETWQGDEGKVALAVAGQITGPAEDGLEVLNTSPLGDLVGGAFADWQISGALETNLNLEMILGEQAAPPRINVHTRWLDVTLDIQPGGLPLRDLQGAISYSTAAGFSSEGLQATLWDRPLQATLQQAHAHANGRYDPRQSSLEIAVAGEILMSDLRRWLRIPQLAFAAGEAAAEVSVAIAPRQAPRLVVRSELQGIGLDLPNPWRKSPAESASLLLEMPLGGDRRLLSLSLNNQHNLSLELGDSGLLGASLGVGAAAAPVETGLVQVAGEVAVIDARQWWDFVGDYLIPADNPMVLQEALTASVAGEPDSSLAVRIDQLFAERVLLAGRVFEAVTLSLEGRTTDWTIDVATEWLRGQVSRASGAERLALTIPRLDLAGLREALETPDAARDAQERAAPAPADAPPALTDLALPAMDVQLESIVDGSRRIGELSFVFVQEGDRYTASEVQGELALARFDSQRPGRMVWLRGNPARTDFEAQLRFDEVGATLEALGYQRVLEAESGSLNVDLSWPGAPVEFDLAGASGALEIALGAGRFPEAPAGAAGALRVVSILNLVDIVQRLSLSQMFESGIPFDSVLAEVYLHAGTIEVPRADISGGSSFQFSGVSDVATRSLSGELVATLPVAKNLPWVAALAASLPVAAGVFVVSKIFDKQMNRLSSGVYRIEGTWDDPQVRFDRIFDDSADLPAMQSDAAFRHIDPNAPLPAGAEPPG
tara:strand:+ start:5266 stop:9237 length:3972 start_codon:yes stop_codon:yes gene_type:complete